MLPPIDDPILSANPKFAALHSTLTKQILNPNGSTRIHAAQKERDIISEGFKTAQVRNAGKHFLKSALQNLDLSPSSPPITSKSKQEPSSQLPAELLELILLLSSQISTPSSTPQTLRLLASTSQWSSLQTYLPQISGLASAHLHTQALLLCKILSPSTNASFLHRTIPKLLPTTTTLQQEVLQKRAELEKRRASLVSNTTTLLTLQHLATDLSIRILEQSKHGSVSRHIKSRSEYLSLSSQQLSYQVQEKKSKGEKMVYTEEVTHALENYAGELRVGKERLKERRREAEGKLWGYGLGRDSGDKEKVLKECARVYGELGRELRGVERDVQKLRGR